MATHVTTATAPDALDDAGQPAPDLAEMNTASMKGWKFFTNFLLWNVISTIGILLLIAVFTVWS